MRWPGWTELVMRRGSYLFPHFPHALHTIEHVAAPQHVAPNESSCASVSCELCHRNRRVTYGAHARNRHQRNREKSAHGDGCGRLRACSEWEVEGCCSIPSEGCDRVRRQAARWCRVLERQWCSRRYRCWSSGWLEVEVEPRLPGWATDWMTTAAAAAAVAPSAKIHSSQTAWAAAPQARGPPAFLLGLRHVIWSRPGRLKAG